MMMTRANNSGEKQSTTGGSNWVDNLKFVKSSPGTEALLHQSRVDRRLGLSLAGFG